jgi:hypothetical protein
MCRCGLNPLKDVQGRESISLCAEGTRNMYSKLAVKNKYDFLKLHHVGDLIKYIDDTRNHKYRTATA